MPSLGLIILLLLVALPLLEIAVLIKVGSIIGFWLSMAIIVTTFILGTMVLRLQGLGVARRFMEAARTGNPPVEPMMEATLLMFAGGCLIAPGFITDTIGLLLLVPAVRQWTARWIITSGFPLAVRMRSGRSYEQSPFDQRPNDQRPRQQQRPGSSSRRSNPAPTIDAEYERIDEKPLNPRGRPPGDPTV